MKLGESMRLPVQLLQRIIGHPVARFSGSGHKRAIGRIEICADATAYPLHGELLDDPFAVTLEDISAETVGFTSMGAVMPSSTTVLSIPLDEEDGEGSVAIRCRIVRCTRQRDGRFHVAAQFLGLCEIQHLISQIKAVS
jgi:hypothetical protein